MRNTGIYYCENKKTAGGFFRFFWGKGGGEFPSNKFSQFKIKIRIVGNNYNLSFLIVTLLQNY